MITNIEIKYNVKNTLVFNNVWLYFIDTFLYT